MNAPQPRFDIRFSRDGDLLRAHVTGVNGSLETTLAYWSALAVEVRRLPPRALLVVDDMEGDPPPPAQIAQFVQAMAGQGFEGVRVAYVEAHAHQIPEVEHGEILAREAGFDARVFGNEDAARVWLDYGGRDSPSGESPYANSSLQVGRMAHDDGTEASFQVIFRLDGGCLVAVAVGWLGDVESIIRMMTLCAVELGRTHRDKLLLLDRTRGVVPPEEEIRRLLAAMAGSGLESVRIAYADVRGTSAGRVEIVEILGRERGYDIRVFDNEARARIWLNYGSH